MNNLIVGRNYDNNKIQHLNLNSQGKIKIDESLKINDIYVQSILNGNTLSRIETDTTELFKYKNKYNIKYLRSQGKCYVAEGNYWVNNTTESQYAYSFYNPTSSGSTAYVYRIKWSYDNEYNDSTTTRLVLRRINTGTPTGAQSNERTPRNLNFGYSDNSGMYCQLKPTTIGTADALFMLGFEDAPSHSAQSFGTLDLDEHFEIPQGKGLAFDLIMGNSTAYDMRFSCSIFYYELDNNNPEFS